MRRIALTALIFVTVLGSSSAHADNNTASPYVDALRKKLDSETPAPTESYTESLRVKLGGSETSQGYSEQVRQQLLKKDTDQLAPVPPSSYTETEKQRLGPPENGGAIQAVNEGHSELKAKRVGEIHHAAGLRYGASLTRDITAAAGAASAPFNSIYGSNYAPDVTLFYEYQPFHSEWFGNFGLVSSLGVGYYHGGGKFSVDLTKPSGGQFGTESRTKFQFFTLPLMAGVDYRFNLLRYLRPFVMVGPTLIYYTEKRSDDRESFSGYSKGVFFSGGVSILLDWINGASSWDLYTEHGVKHYYLTVDYSRLSTFSGVVSVAVSGINAGLTFEF